MLELQDNPTRISYTCTGGETSFAYPFRIFEEEDLKVYRNTILQAIGVDYTITNPTGPGDVIPLFTPIAGDIVLLVLDIPIVRTIEYQNGNSLNANTLNLEDDRIYAILNQINTGVNDLCPHYAQSSNPNDPDDLVLPILGINEYWVKGPGGAIVAASTIPDPAAGILRAELASSDPMLGAYLVNTEKNVRVQTVLANMNYATIVASGYEIQLGDYCKTLILENDASVIDLPGLSTLPDGFWIKIRYDGPSEAGFITVNATGSDSIKLYGSFKYIGASRTFTFTNLNGVWHVLDNDYTDVGKEVDFDYEKPDGEYLPRDGRAVSRTDYNILFAKYGTTWGPGDGSTTFNIPDSRGRSPLGAGAGPGLTTRTLAQTGGEENHALTESENGPHDHDFPTDPTFEPGAKVVRQRVTPGGNGFQSGGDFAGDVGSLVSSGSGTPHNTMHPYYVNYPMIKAF